MNTIILDYDPFAMESRICIMTDGHTKYNQVTSEIDDAAEVIVGLAYSNNIYNVKLHAPSQMVGEISRRIQEQEQNDFANNKIVIDEITVI